jgi:hypothetical protein
LTDVNSRRLHAGAKWHLTISPESSLYVGAAWEHEYDGKASASIYGYRLDTPELRGNTGKREGMTGSIRVGYHF